MALTFVRKRGPYKLKNPHILICGVYSITNTITGETYVGCSMDVIKRMRNHRDAMKGGYANKKLNAAVAQYGMDAFKFMVLEECHELERYKAEKKWIEHMEPEYNTWPDTAPNNKGTKNPGWKNSGSFKPGGAGHTTPHTEESKAKVSASKTGVPWSKARREAEERRKQHA